MSRCKSELKSLCMHRAVFQQLEWDVGKIIQWHHAVTMQGPARPDETKNDMWSRSTLHSKAVPKYSLLKYEY